MKLTALYLKTMCAILCLFIFTLSATAQSELQNQEIKAGVPTIVVFNGQLIHTKETGIQNTATTIKNNQVKNTAFSKTINNKVNESTARNCSYNKSDKPFTISIADFNKLPCDRQEFLLQNTNKYTIAH